MRKYCGHWGIIVWWDEFNWWCDLFESSDQTFKTIFNQKINVPCDTKQRIREIAIKMIVHILSEKSYGDFLFEEILLSGLPKPVKLSNRWIKKYFQYQEPKLYSRLLDDSEKRTLWSPSWTFTDIWYKKIVPDAPKLYILQKNMSDCEFCSL